MTKQFNFYKTYADLIGEFTNTEAGSFIKKLCTFMFLDEQLNVETKDKVTSILILLSATLAEERDGTCTTRSKGKYFTFKSVYASSRLRKCSFTAFSILPTQRRKYDLFVF